MGKTMKRDWFIYRIDNLSLSGWRSFGVLHEQIKDNRDMSAMARAINILSDCVPDIDWYNRYHEFWLLECPCAPPIVCVRPETNPYQSGYIVSPIPMPHLESSQEWFLSREGKLEFPGRPQTE